MRAMISVGPPGANGTIKVMGRSGQAARAGAMQPAGQQGDAGERKHGRPEHSWPSPRG